MAIFRGFDRNRTRPTIKMLNLKLDSSEGSSKIRVTEKEDHILTDKDPEQLDRIRKGLTLMISSKDIEP